MDKNINITRNNAELMTSEEEVLHEWAKFVEVQRTRTPSTAKSGS